MLRPASRYRVLPTALAAAWIVGGLLLFAGTIATSLLFADDVGEALTRNTVRLSLGWYFAALLLMVRGRGDAADYAARWCWTWGWLTFVVHVGMAMHYYHHWSTAAAIEHTREVSGVGEGVYISYLFTLVWGGDVAWWWLAPGSRAGRPAWIGRALHGYMLFMVFNGTVIYESGPIRYVAAAALIILFAIYLAALTCVRPRSRESIA